MKIPRARFRFGKTRWFSTGFMALGIAGAVVQSAYPKPIPVPPPTPEQAAFFEEKIRPVLIANCLPCHGKTTQLGGLRLDTKEGFTKGGGSGSLVVPGDPGHSLLVTAVRQTGQLKMPQGGKLTPAQILDIETWVKMGAAWPDDNAPKAPAPQLWSLVPVKKPPVPLVKDKTWVRNPIDAFVLSKLETHGLSPAPTADKRTLIRRVTYDLTGLPPTPEEVDSFVSDKSPDAYERVVDRLLDSPHFGERWARHWLDVARYADTKGYVFNEDRNYPNAYTYRDWVIQAFNHDLPYNRFVVEQLAADRLPETQAEEDKHDLAALGFLTVGRRFLNQEPDIIDDRIDVTMRGFEGFTVACARCHDHKFDPIPTQDYYSLYAIFASSKEESVPISAKAVSEPWEKHNSLVDSAESAEQKLVLEQVNLLREKNKDAAKSGELSQEVKQTLQSLNPKDVAAGHNLDVLRKSFDPSRQTDLENLEKEIGELEKNTPPSPQFAMAMADAPDPHDGVVFKRGNPGNPGPTAPRRFLLALSKPGEERPHWTKDSGRLELAQDIASPDNPLTARVFVNRNWMYHFGAGIVRTPSDFGHQGEPPTDPQLLDYLAATFVENGWSVKKLNRLIVTSATYRQSSDVSPKTFNADPDNRLCSRMNRQRLDLEEIRDSLMQASGKLDLKDVGGKSVDLWSEPFTDRRAVYGFVERQNLPGIFRTFDFATPDATSPKRFVTTVPQQALFFMNSPLVVDEARLVADREEIKNANSDGQRVRRLYRLLFGRLPDADETAMGLAYLGKDWKNPIDSPDSSWQYGYGGYDSGAKRVTGFTPFAVFDKVGYHVGNQFPDPGLGYLVLNPNGGHPGRDQNHAVIRRWKAFADMTVRIDGSLAHRQSQGDGIRGRIVSSRDGPLGEWQVHNNQADTHIESVKVKKGDTIDFMVDPLASDAFDAFQWSPTVTTIDGKQVWSAVSGFGPPNQESVNKLILYAQALMMTNEFMFVD